MRIVSNASPGGNIYRIYRADDDFVADMQRLIPFLNEFAELVFIGGDDADTDVVLTVGPLAPEVDAAFQKRVSRHLA